jgi:hypothetical protein
MREGIKVYGVDTLDCDSNTTTLELRYSHTERTRSANET